MDIGSLFWIGIALWTFGLLIFVIIFLDTCSDNHAIPWSVPFLSSGLTLMALALILGLVTVTSVILGIGIPTVVIVGGAYLLLALS